MAPIVLSGLLKYIKDLESVNTKETNELKSFLFSSIGLLSKRIPSLFSKDLSILNLYFSKLSTEDGSVLPSIQEGLISICPAYQNISEDQLSQISLLLRSVIKNNENFQSKFCSLYYLNRLFNFDYVPARFACLISTSDTRPEVKDEAFRGLKPFLRKGVDIVVDSTQPYPSFNRFIQFLMEEENLLKQNNELPLPPAMFEELLRFLQTTFQSNANFGKISEIEFVKNLIQSEEKIVLFYLELLEKGLNSSQPNLYHLSIEILLSLISLQSHYFGQHYSSRFDWLLLLLYVGNLESRERIGKIVGIVAPHLPASTLSVACSKMSQKLVPNLLTSSVDDKCSSIFALSATISRFTQLHQQLPSEFIPQVLFQFYQLLDQNSPTIVAACSQGIGWIGRYSSLPFSKEKVEEDPSAPISTPEQLKLIHFVRKLTTKLDSTDSKVIERTAIALVNLCLGDNQFPFYKEILEALFSTAKQKNEEIHFTVGEALSCLGSGWKSGASVDPIFDTNVELPSIFPSSEIMQDILKTIFGEYLPKDRFRSPVAIWILSLVTHSGKDKVIQSSLPFIQKNLSFLLSDNNG